MMAKPSLFETEQGDEPGMPPEPDVPQLRLFKVPARVDEDGLAEIERAVTLKLATLCMLGRITPELYGKALTGIAREWVNTTMCRVRANKDD